MSQCDSDDSYVLIDDAGNVVDPGEEHSCLMAVEYGPDVIEDNTELHDWYLVELAKAQEHMSNNPQLEEMIRQASQWAGDDDDEEEESEVEELGMEGGMCSRDYSEGYEQQDGEEEEWVLEKILKRKAKAAGDWLYLCKWKWYADPTWEARTLLEDEGWGKALAAFDATKLPQQTNRQGRVRKPKEPKPKIFTPTTLEQLCPGSLEKVCKQFAACNYSVVRYAPVQNRQLETRFFEAMTGLGPNTHFPTILYHGTRKANITPICESGLLIPGHGNVRVLNGSAYGVGIYTARDPHISVGYSTDMMMFVCLGLIGPRIATTKQANDIFVFFEERLLVPMWVVEFRVGSWGREPRRVALHEMLSIPFTQTQETYTPQAIPSMVASPPPPSAPLHPGEHHPLAQRPITKKMLRQAPKSVKDLYKMGKLRQKKV